jgi:hypothetical protein
MHQLSLTALWQVVRGAGRRSWELNFCSPSLVYSATANRLYRTHKLEHRTKLQSSMGLVISPSPGMDPLFVGSGGIGHGPRPAPAMSSESNGSEFFFFFLVFFPSLL